ncbi:MAG TPA: hypothetical protein VEB43_17675 [Anaeromyxobacter sp.]|nr:hypothetical protein [Anaeromyxobacter sp.]
MRTPRLLAVPFLLLALAACKKAPPPERFIAGDTAMAVVVPSLASFAMQGTDVLDTAATFPGGQNVNDLRAVAESRLGFDLFDAASLAKAGFDPKRGAAVGFRMDEGGPPEMIAALPAGDEKKLAETLDVLAKERMQLETRSTEGDVVKWGPEGGPAMLAYAFTEKTVVVGAGPTALELVQAALKVPKDGHLGAKPDYKAALQAAGAGQAVVWYFSSQGPMFELPQLAPMREMFKKGFALGLSGAKDRLAFAVGMPLDDESPFAKMGKADASPLVARLDPNAGWVARSDTDAATTFEFQRPMLRNMLETMGAPEGFRKAVDDAFGAISGGTAMSVGVVPVEAGAPSIREAPLAFFRVELLVGIKDAAKTKEAIRALVKEGPRMPPGEELDLSGDGPWTFPAVGGEVGVAVEDKQLLLVAGPKGSLEALGARSGTTFKPPTATATKALQGSMGGMYIDVPKLAGGLKVIPAAAFGDDPEGTVLHSNVQKVASVLSRFTAVSVSADVKDKTYRGELVIEVAPPAAK